MNRPSIAGIFRQFGGKHIRAFTLNGGKLKLYVPRKAHRLKTVAFVGCVPRNAILCLRFLHYFLNQLGIPKQHNYNNLYRSPINSQFNEKIQFFGI